jgi:glycosyltransferase involved in cell wall biosynthesis
MRSLKLMQIVSGTGFNGAMKYALDIIQLLRKQGHQVTPVCLPDSWLSDELARLGIACVPTELNRWPSNDLKSIAKVFHDGQYDLVHTHNSRAHAFGSLLRMFHSIPCIATAHQRHLQLHWPFNDFIIANSDATLHFHRTYHLISKRRSRRIYCPIDVERFAHVPQEDTVAMRRLWDVGQDDLLLGSIGNIIPRKAQRVLIEAMPKVLRKVPNAKVIIVGLENGTYAAECKQLADELQVSHAIRWVGYESRVPAVMHAIDVCVCCPREEAFGLTAAEAHAAGKPVVATNVGGLPEIVTDGENGYLVDKYNHIQLADAITKLLRNPQLRSEFGERGRVRAQQLFGVKEHMAMLEGVYERVLGIYSRPALSSRIARAIIGERRAS